MYVGDFPEDFTTVTIIFTTHAASGAPVAPSTAFENADVDIFKNGSATEKTAVDGLTMTSPFNSTTGLHCLVIDTNNDTNDAGFWVAGATYTVVLTPDETVDSLAVAKVIGVFSLAMNLRSTTAGRTLTIESDGMAHADLKEWKGSAPASLADTDKVSASVQHMATGIITATVIAADAIGASELAADAATEIGTAVWATATRALTDKAGFSLAADQSGVTIGTLNALAANSITAAAAAADFGTEVGTAVWATAARVLTANTNLGIGTPSDLGSGATLAGNLVDIEAQTDDIGAAGAGLTALATQASVNTIDDFLDTEIADIQARLPAALSAGGFIKADLQTWLAVAPFALTGTGRVQADLRAIAGSATGAYLNLISMFDGTGYAGGTIKLGVNIVAMAADVLTAAATAADFGTEIGTAVWATTTRALSNTGIDAIMTRAITEAYSTKNGTVTLGQALYELLARDQEVSISGTTMTLKQRDQAATAMTLTLDDGSSPNALTRAT